MRLTDRFVSFASENPMKIYPVLYMLGDGVSALHGTVGTGSKIWTISAGFAIAAHGLKLAFGKGGEKLAPAAGSLRARLKTFFRDFAGASIRPVFPSFWRDLKKGYAQTDVAAVRSRLKNSVCWPHRYPMDAGYLLIGVAGAGFMLDASNAMGLRESGSVIEFMLGALIAAGSATGFATQRNDLAGQLFTATTLLTVAAGVASGSIPLVAALPIYLLGNYILGQVKTDHQSAYTTARIAPKVTGL